MIEDFEQALEQIEAIVDDILSQHEITAPPVDVRTLARKMGLILNENKLEGRRGQNFIFRGKKYVEVEIRDRKVRQNFTIAHEVLEVEMTDITTDPALKHKLALFGSSFLLMPLCWFRKACLEHNFDLFDVKNIFNNVSHEAVALHMLYLEPAVVTVFDNNRVSNRRSSYPFYVSRQLFPPEKKAIQQVLAAGDKCHLQAEGMEITGFPVFEKKFKRVILRTLLDEFTL